MADRLPSHPLLHILSRLIASDAPYAPKPGHRAMAALLACGLLWFNPIRATTMVPTNMRMYGTDAEDPCGRVAWAISVAFVVGVGRG